MRFRLPLLAFAGLLLPIGAMTLVSACGNNGDNTVVDASNDTTTKDQATADVAPDVTAVDAGCDAPGLAQVIPDSGIEAGDGGFPIVACLNCFTTQCNSQVNACNADCACREEVVTTVNCFIQTQDLTTCGQNALFSGNSNVTALVGCAFQKCVSICAPGDAGVIQDAGNDG